MSRCDRRIRHRFDGDEPHQARRRRRSGHVHGDRIFGFNLWALALLSRLFRRADRLRLERRLVGFGNPSALRLGAENLAWSLMFIIQPSAASLSCRSFARWLQPSVGSTATYVFEGLRGVLIDHVLRTDLMLTDSRSIRFFHGSRLRLCVPARSARRAGTLLQTGNRNRRADHAQVTTILEWGASHGVRLLMRQ